MDNESGTKDLNSGRTRHKGYYGIGTIGCKTSCNIGGLLRSAYAFNASFGFCIGARYRRQASDTVNFVSNVPYYQYSCFDEFYSSLPKGCRLICVEITSKSRNIVKFIHPWQCVYLLGPEDGSIPSAVLDKSYCTLEIPTKVCLNLASAATVVLYDRFVKLGE
jgi:tRNA(Leu) C34 or U34 (ribose-2'-O)-methylase TrmL